MNDVALLPSLVLEREFAHPPEKLWRALTQRHLIEEWLMNNDFEAVLGARFNLRSEPSPHWNGVVDCEVLALEPQRKLSYTWNSSGEEAGRLRTVVTYTLTPTARGTHLRLEQSGFRPGDQAAYQGASWGWQRFLGGLEKVVAGLK